MSQGGENLLWRGFIDERRIFLSTLPPTTAQLRLATGTVAVSAVLFLLLLPFAKQRVGELWAFIPIYQSAFVVCDVVTAVLLFGQFGFLRSRALLVLASGYLFTAFMAAAHALTFPGLFAQTGLLGAGPHSTAWIYNFWHAGFPLAFIGYAALKGDGGQVRISTRAAVLASVATVLALVVGLTALATAGRELLPSLMRANQSLPAQFIVIHCVWLLSAIAAAVLWWRKPHSTLDIWLMVVMAIWFFDVALSAAFNAGRWDVGFFAGRIYGLAAASFVLIVLMVENGSLYGRLVAAHESEFRERRRAQEKAVELSEVNKELEAFSYSVSHDLRAPLRAVDGYARMLEEDHAAQLDGEGRRLLGEVRAGSGEMARMIDDLLEFSRTGKQQLQKDHVDMTALAREVTQKLAGEYSKTKVEIAELPGAFADRNLLRQALVNLVGNAFKYTGKRAEARIEIGARQEQGENVYWVRDNGAGFDMRFAAKLFGVFQRMHRAEEFPGTGVGLAIVQRVISRHGGRVWAEAKPDAGACFFFSLPRTEAD